MRWWLLATVAVLAGSANADELKRSLVKSGDWAAVEHAPAATAPPDMCLAIDPTVGLALRADAGGTELVVENPHWDWPAVVRWTIKVTVGPETRTFSITSNTTNRVGRDQRIGCPHAAGSDGEGPLDAGGGWRDHAAQGVAVGQHGRTERIPDLCKDWLIGGPCWRHPIAIHGPYDTTRLRLLSFSRPS
jgi:hypothetical protein